MGNDRSKKDEIGGENYELTNNLLLGLTPIDSGGSTRSGNLWRVLAQSERDCDFDSVYHNRHQTAETDMVNWIGPKTREWNRVRARLKIKFERAGITTCEFCFED